MSPATRWLLFHSGQPLVIVTRDHPTTRGLAYLTTNDVKPFLGSEPFFGQGKDKGQLVIESSDVQHSPTEAARHHDTPIIFLGVREPPSKSGALPSSNFADADAAIANIEGTPFFSMDIADLELAPEKIRVILDSTSQAEHGILDWSEPRIMMSSLDNFSGGIFAEARSLVDWNQRNKVCLTSFLNTYILRTSFSSSVQHVAPVPIPCGVVGSFRARHYCHGRTMQAEHRA